MALTILNPQPPKKIKNFKKKCNVIQVNGSFHIVIQELESHGRAASSEGLVPKCEWAAW